MPAPTNRRCQVESCDRKHHANNYCEKHNRQVSQHGHILTGNYLSEQGKKARAASSGSKGKHWSEEARQRYSKAYKGIRKNTGRTHFEKGHKTWNTGTKGVMKSWNKGKPLSAETKKKLSEALKGRAVWNKIGDGITSETKLLRHKFRKTIQEQILARDNYTCQICDQYSGYLHVDHIKSWKDYPELRFDLNNCRTLCRACHYYVTFKRKMPSSSKWGIVNMTKRVG